MTSICNMCKGPSTVISTELELTSSYKILFLRSTNTEHLCLSGAVLRAGETRTNKLYALILKEFTVKLRKYRSKDTNYIPMCLTL